MKKVMISLLMVAATLNAFAITYTGKAKLTLTSSDNKSCTMTIGESADLNDGLNNGYYAALNEEGLSVQLYVLYNNVKYQQFASSAATMEDLHIGVKTNAATTYSMTASNVVGSIRIMFKGVEYTINSNGVVFSSETLDANSVLPAAGDEASYRVQPSAPIVPSMCFEKNILKINGHAGEPLIVKYGATELVNETLGDTYTSPDFGALVPAETRLVVTLAGVDYQIDVNPVVTPLVLVP